MAVREQAACPPVPAVHRVLVKTPAVKENTGSLLLRRYSGLRPLHSPTCSDLSMFVSFVLFLGPFLLQRHANANLVPDIWHSYPVHTKNASFGYLAFFSPMTYSPFDSLDGGRVLIP